MKSTTGLSKDEGGHPLRALRELDGYRVEGQGGALGEVIDTYFDDHSWTVRYLMIAGGGRGISMVLLSPHSLRRIDRRGRRIMVALTPAQFRAIPSVEAVPAISRAAEIGLLEYYGFPYYWTGRHRWGNDLYPKPLTAAPTAGTANHVMEPWPEAHLRSVRDFRHYTLHATDGELGHVDDLLSQDRSWAVRYIVVETRRWWPAGRVVLASRVGDLRQLARAQRPPQSRSGHAPHRACLRGGADDRSGLRRPIA
jgi:hypothetical protein